MGRIWSARRSVLVMPPPDEVVEEHVEHGLEMAGETVAAGVVGDLLGAEASDQRGVDLEVGGGAGAERRAQAHAPAHQALRQRVGRRRGLEPGMVRWWFVKPTRTPRRAGLPPRRRARTDLSGA